jgi:hypothetical protein
MDNEQEIIQHMLEQYRTNVAKYNDAIAMRQEGASLDALHPEMDEEEAREYSVDLSQFAQRHGL